MEIIMGLALMAIVGLGTLAAVAVAMVLLALVRVIFAIAW